MDVGCGVDAEVNYSGPSLEKAAVLGCRNLDERPRCGKRTWVRG